MRGLDLSDGSVKALLILLLLAANILLALAQHRSAPFTSAAKGRTAAVEKARP